MILEVSRIAKSFPSRTGEKIQVLKNVNLALHSGDFAAIEGASGSGKSTLLLICGTLLAPDSGSVKLCGETLADMPIEAAAAFRAHNIGFVFQRFHLLPYLTVEENIRAGEIATGAKPADTTGLELMDRFEISHRRHHFPGELSVGERQRTALARALYPGPILILADEPTGNLDPPNARIVLDALSHFAKEGGAVLLVTHNPEAAAAASIRMRMENGILAQKHSESISDPTDAPARDR